MANCFDFFSLNEMHRTISKNISWISTSFSRKARAKPQSSARSYPLCSACRRESVFQPQAMIQIHKVWLFSFFLHFINHLTKSLLRPLFSFQFLTPENKQTHRVKHVRRQKPTSSSLPQKRRVSSFLWFFNRNCVLKFGVASYMQPVFITIPNSKPKHENSTEVSVENINGSKSCSASSPHKQRENGGELCHWEQPVHLLPCFTLEILGYFVNICVIMFPGTEVCFTVDETAAQFDSCPTQPVLSV